MSGARNLHLHREHFTKASTEYVKDDIENVTEPKTMHEATEIETSTTPETSGVRLKIKATLWNRMQNL